MPGNGENKLGPKRWCKGKLISLCYSQVWTYNELPLAHCSRLPLSGQQAVWQGNWV